MANTFVKIATVTVGSGGSANMDFSSIPSTYTDLCLLLSSRDTYSAGDLEVFLRFNNNSGSVYTYRRLLGTGSTTGSATGTDTKLFLGAHPGATATSNTFGNFSIYIPNYAGSTAKSVSVDAVQENNQTTAIAYLTAGISTDTSAINRITLLPQTNFAEYSTATLYGISNS
jgi:hypothetical protein